MRDAVSECLGSFRCVQLLALLGEVSVFFLKQWLALCLISLRGLEGLQGVLVSGLW